MTDDTERNTWLIRDLQHGTMHTYLDRRAADAQLDMARNIDHPAALYAPGTHPADGDSPEVEVP